MRSYVYLLVFGVETSALQMGPSIHGYGAALQPSARQLFAPASAGVMQPRFGDAAMAMSVVEAEQGSVSRFDRFNDWAAEKGAALKSRTKAATQRGKDAEMLPARLVWFTKAAALYMLFVMYRAYRGFGVVLPAVVMEVHGKLREGVVVEAPAESDSAGGKRRVKFRTQVGIFLGTILYTSAILLKYAADALGKVVRGVVGAIGDIFGFSKPKPTTAAP